MVRLTPSQQLELGEVLKEKRLADELSQEQLAIILDTTQGMISLLELGKRGHVGDSLWAALKDYLSPINQQGRQEIQELFDNVEHIGPTTSYHRPKAKDDRDYNQMIYVKKKYRKLWDKSKRIAKAHNIGVSEMVMRALVVYADKQNWKVD